MSHFSYTYETLFTLDIQHPDTIPVIGNVTFVPSESTALILNKYKLIMKPTVTGFVVAYRTSTTYDEVKDPKGNVTHTPNGSVDWLDTNSINISLNIFCIATQKFIENTAWKDLGPRAKKNNEVTLVYQYILYRALYDAPASAPDIDNAPITKDYSLENNDYKRLQVAELNFKLSGHIPNNTHKTNTIII
ncbi:hypothetical protein GCM10022393_27120 [Aquimarina addita]|uniref:Uncharacterized protein n=1 Tax=Aquimarina addita TaxID=870485 RepID=A0ABP6ULQ6_9FLAO